MLARWREQNVFERSLANREGAPVWSFYEGPPTANGRPGSHHVLARVFKDVYPRYRTMTGYRVPRKAGWDCHGLPVELEVEKDLGISSKQEIEEFGIAEFNQRCRESVFEYVEEWDRLTERIGFWIDLDDPYVTLENDYIESVWWSLRQLWDKELLYEGHKVVPYCPRDGTPLSSHEVAQGYQEVDDPSIYVRFPLLGAERESLLVWTTTPWTLPGNEAVAVAPDVVYVKARVGEEVLILAEALVAKVLGEGVEILDRIPGSELVGTNYEGPLFDLSDRRARRLPGDRRRLRHHRGRHRPRPHRPRLRRGRLHRRGGQRPLRPDRRRHPLQPGPARRDLRPPRRRLRGPLRQGPGGDPGPDRRPRQPRAALPRAGLHALLPALLALRDAAPLLRDHQLVHRHLAEARPAARQQRGDRLAPRARQARPLRQMAREQHRLGALAQPLLGDAAADLALHRTRLRRPRLHRLGRRAAGALARRLRPRRPPPPLHRRGADPLRSRRLRRRDGAGQVGDRHLVRQRRDAVRPVPLPVRGRGGVRGALPGRLHLRGPGPDPRLVLHAAGRVDAAVRHLELPQLRLPRPDPRPRGPEDVEEPRQRRRPLGRARQPRRRRLPLVLPGDPAALGRLPLLGRDGRRSRAPVHPPALEHLLLLGPLRQRREPHPRRLPIARFLCCGGRNGGTTGWERPGSLGPLAAAGDGGDGARADGRLRLHQRRPRDRRLRRGALQLVRAALAPPLLGGRPRRLRDPAPLPAGDGGDAGALHALPRRRDPPQPRRRRPRARPASSPTRSTCATSPRSTRGSPTPSSRRGWRRCG